MPDISIIIVTYNPGDRIKATLDSIPTVEAGYTIETVVVDNKSQDETRQLIEREYPHVRLIASPENLGFSGGNNLGFQHVRGRYIVLVNPDLVLKPDTLTCMIRYLEAHEDVGIVGPRTFDDKGGILATGRTRYTLPRLLARYLGLALVFPQSVYGEFHQLAETADAPFDVDWLQGSCLAMPRTIFEQLNGFDDNFFLFMEDADLCERAKQAGWRVVYLPDAVVNHAASSTVSRYPLVRIRSYHLSSLQYTYKHSTPAATTILRSVFVVELAARSLMHRLQSALNHDQISLEKARAEWRVIKDVLTWQPRSYASQQSDIES